MNNNALQRVDDRLALCTESLCSESCDGCIASDEADLATEAEEMTRSTRRTRSRGRRREEETSVFPPPLTWLVGKDGRRSNFMRAVKKDGRFLLTEVRLNRPEIFRAVRQDGRLRLQFIQSDGGEEEKVEEEEMEVRGEEERGGQWEWPWGFRRCQEAVSGNNAPFGSNHRFLTTA